MIKRFAFAAYLAVCLGCVVFFGHALVSSRPDLELATTLPAGARVVSGPKYDRALAIAKQYWQAEGVNDNCKNGATFYLLPFPKKSESHDVEGKAFTDCRIGVNFLYANNAEWSDFCAVVVHEWGHEQGKAHTSTGIMSPKRENGDAPSVCRDPADMAAYPGSMAG